MILKERFGSFLLRFFLLLTLSSLAAAEIRINEVVSSNGNTIADEDGNYEDWIEIYNPGTEPVDLGGWGLSDSPDSPFKWVFPAPMVINGGGYFLVWASSKNRIVPGAPLHTNFSVSISGEHISLTHPDGTSADSVAVPSIPRNTSFGRKPFGGLDWFYFEASTPRAANTTVGYPDLMIPPAFSHQGGFYTSAFPLALDVPDGWTVYYTLDGSEPDPSRVGSSAPPYRKSRVYSQPIPVASRAGDENVFSEIPTTGIVRSWLPAWKAPEGEVFKATVVRAMAYDPATGRRSRMVTNTFFVDENIMSRYAGMPVISLVSDYKNLFDNQTGIYVPGSSYAGVESEQNFFKGWVRPANLEYFESDGTPGFSDVYDISIQGSTSPGCMQKGLHVATGDASADSRIRYPLFAAAESPAKNLTEFKRFILRAWGSARRYPVIFTDAYHHTLVAKSDLEIQDYRPAVVFINGEYWGLHEMRESNKNSWYHQYRTGIDRVDPGFDMLDDGGSIVDEGDSLHWDAIMDYINSHNLANDSVYQYVTTQIDVENFAKYIVHCVFTGKRDWPEQNEALWRARTPDGRWRWTQFDMDHGLYNWSTPSYDMLTHAIKGVDGYGPHPLFVKLLVNPKFKRMFINTYTDWLNSYFLTAVELAHFDAMKAELEPFIAEFDERWPISHESYGWETGTASGRNLISERRNDRREQLRSYFSLGSLRSVILKADASKGLIRCNSMLVDENTPGVSPGSPYPWQRSYFQNMPIELSAVPRDGYRFVGWRVWLNGSPLPSLPGSDPTFYSQNTVITLSLTDSGTRDVEAVFELIPYLDLHVWDFENQDSSQPSFTTGGGLLESTPAAGGSVVLAPAEVGFTSSHLRVNTPIGARLDWSMPTTGYQSVVLGFSTRRSSTGAGLQSISYTLDGSVWTLLESYAVADADPQPKTFNFSGIPGANNNPNFALRIAFDVGGGGTAGNNRFDDVTLRGTVLQGTNLPPEITSPMYDRHLVAGASPVLINLGGFFEDPDGDPLVFQVQSHSSGIISAGISGSQLSLSGLSTGEGRITVTAMVGDQPTASQTFGVLVYPSPFVVGNAIFRFNQWSANEPAGSYPANMLFLQGDVADPVLETPLVHAYAIPETDAALPQDVNYPYAATSRTRINGLGEQGISFVNTGRERDLGAVLLALDTTGQSNIELRWTAGTVAANSRVYGLSLQYRLDPGAAWVAFPGGSIPVNYQSSTEAGHQLSFGPLRLPAVLENQPHVQIQWRYHHVSGDLGNRAEIRLDDIVLYAARSYDDWVADWYAGPDAVDPAVSGPMAEPTHDGTPNLLKYALNIPPALRITKDQLEMGSMEDGRLFARFYMDRSRGDITYRIHASSDMLDWSEVIFDSKDFWGGNSNGNLHEVIVPSGSEDRKFIRFSVERK